MATGAQNTSSWMGLQQMRSDLWKLKNVSLNANEAQFAQSLASRSDFDIDRIFVDGYSTNVINQQVLNVVSPLFEAIDDLEVDVHTIGDSRYEKLSNFVADVQQVGDQRYVRQSSLTLYETGKLLLEQYRVTSSHPISTFYFSNMPISSGAGIVTISGNNTTVIFDLALLNYLGRRDYFCQTVTQPGTVNNYSITSKNLKINNQIFMPLLEQQSIATFLGKSMVGSPTYTYFSAEWFEVLYTVRLTTYIDNQSASNSFSQFYTYIALEDELNAPMTTTTLVELHSKVGQPYYWSGTSWREHTWTAKFLSDKFYNATNIAVAFKAVTNDTNIRGLQMEVDVQLFVKN